MSTKIQTLSEEAINQIAAGEVIENPASVVKELVENSLDAGARKIEIVILAGGQERIRVIDDGCGMGPSDALLALTPHATSKIRSADDIATVQTMGFRGEALASIGAISKLMLETSEGEEGVRLTFHGGAIQKSEPIARAQGTLITVDELFYNTPVRKGFQRSRSADTAQVKKTVTLLALAHPEVSFTLRQGEDTLLQTHALLGLPFLDAFSERAREVLGEGFSKSVIPFTYEKGGVRMRGLLGTPDETRPSRASQMLLINRRPVVSSLVSNTIREAFSTRLPTGRHPLFALHLDLPCNMLDVNVHPQKREVRIQEEYALQGEIITAISRALEEEKPAFQEPLSFKVPTLEEATIPFEPLPVVEGEVVEETQTETLFAPPIKVFGIVSDYLVSAPCGPFADEEGFLMIDTKRARARIEFERMKKALEKGEIASQTLAHPITLELLPDEVEQITQCQAALQKLGVGARPFGGNTVLIERLPFLLSGVEPKRVLERLLPTLKLDGVWEEAAAREACRAFPSAPITLDQAGLLVKEWLECKELLRCPQGKPICFLLSVEEMERRLRHGG